MPDSEVNGGISHTAASELLCCTTSIAGAHLDSFIVTATTIKMNNVLTNAQFVSVIAWKMAGKCGNWDMQKREINIITTGCGIGVMMSVLFYRPLTNVIAFC